MALEDSIPAMDEPLCAMLARPRRFEEDGDWTDLAALWSVRPGTTYLNHGSFGLMPRPVRALRDWWQQRCEEQPMDCLVRELEPAWWGARESLARFTGTSPEHLILGDHATWAMNVVADSVPLQAGDEVLLTDHEYGAVRRIWERAAGPAGARVESAALPFPVSSAMEVVQAIMDRTGPRTRLIVVSHITSPTAITLPVREICSAARDRGIAVCIDGPHALVQCDVEIDSLGCDFYCASCHKWLCAPLGTGFLFVHPRWQDRIRTPVLSWGRLLPAVPQRWDEQFTWSGTRNPAAWLAITGAIRFIEAVGVQVFRARTHWLARRTRARLEELTGCSAMIPDDPAWYQSMTEVPLPKGDWSTLQDRLWREWGIEVPIVRFADRWLVRVSHHLYTTTAQVDRLLESLTAALGR